MCALFRRPRPSRRRVGRVAAALLVALTVGAAVPASAETTSITEVQDELESAQDELGQMLARIDEVEAQVAAADARLAELADGLAQVRASRDAAEANAAAADLAVAVAHRALGLAQSRAEAAEARADQARSALEDRVAMIFMHGPGGGAEVFLDGLLVAETLHDVATVQHASARAMEADRRLMEAADDAEAEAAAARAQADDERIAVEASAVEAHAARKDAEVLVDTQAELVSRANAERAARSAALARIEQDVEARAALVGRLTKRIADLRAASLDDWLRAVQDLPTDGPSPAWAGNLPAAGQPMASVINAAAAASGIDGRLFAALVWTESSFRPAAVSPHGAIGLTQLMPGTAAGLGVDPHDPVQNLLGGARYLRIQLDRFGRVDLALAAYNAGPTRVADAGPGIPDIVETQLYVLRILDRWEKLG